MHTFLLALANFTLGFGALFLVAPGYALSLNERSRRKPPPEVRPLQHRFLFGAAFILMGITLFWTAMPLVHIPMLPAIPILYKVFAVFLVILGVLFIVWPDPVLKFNRVLEFSTIPEKLITSYPRIMGLALLLAGIFIYWTATRIP